MAKPILFIQIPSQEALTAGLLQIIVNDVKEATGNEYHVIITTNSYLKSITMNCYNDCKGLPDIDIKVLVDSIIKR